LEKFKEHNRFVRLTPGNDLIKVKKSPLAIFHPAMPNYKDSGEAMSERTHEQKVKDVSVEDDCLTVLPPTASCRP
jgi:hypothetical protein